MRRGTWSGAARAACIAAVAPLLAACDSKPLDWNALVAARIGDQVPGAAIQAVDPKTLEARLNGKTLRIDTADLSLQCNRGTRDCDRAFEQVIVELRGPAAEVRK